MQGGPPTTSLPRGLLLAVLVLVLLAAIAVALRASPSASGADLDCSDFSNQSQAQQNLLPGDPYGLDADGDGVACESLPCPCASGGGGGGGGSGAGNGGGGQKPSRPHCRRPSHDVRITFSKSDYPNIIRHIKYSFRIGYPKRLVIWRKGADQRRDQLLQGIPTKPGYDRDEAPAAVLRKKVKADVRYVPSGENRSAGSSLGRQISGYCNGVHVRYRFTP
jgi:hypothetical protein